MKIGTRQSDLPTVVVFLFLFVYTLYPDSNVLIQIVRVILCVTMALFIKLKKDVFRSKYLLWNISFIVLCFFSSFWALNKSVSLSGLYTLIYNSIFVIFIYFYAKENKEFFWNVLKCFIIVPLFWPFVVVIRYGFSALLNVRMFMFGALYNRPGIVAAFGAICAYFIYRFLDKSNLVNRSSKKKWVIFFVLNILICIMTTSRKSFIILIVACILIEIMKSKNPIKSIVYLSIIIIGIWIILTKVPFIYNLVGYRVEEMIISIFHDNDTFIENYSQSTNGRFNRIERGIEWFKNKKIIGYGLENYSVLSGIYRKGFDGIADNNYIEILVDLGLVGFVLYYSFVVYLLIKNLKYRLDEKSFLSFILIVALIISDIGSCNYKSAICLLVLSLCDVHFYEKCK